jgi:hypothetical protein
MPSSLMVCSATLVRTDVSEERIAYITRVTRIGELCQWVLVAVLLVCVYDTQGAISKLVPTIINKSEERNPFLELDFKHLMMVILVQNMQ